jgi:hypothetical protein
MQRGDAGGLLRHHAARSEVADRLVQAQAALPDEELARLAASSEERRAWQRECNLRTLLAAGAGVGVISSGAISGRLRNRCPVNLNTAFATAGATGGVAGSPMPSGGSHARQDHRLDQRRLAIRSTG